MPVVAAVALDFVGHGGCCVRHSPRWFYVRDFARHYGVGRSCLFDSDIMLFSSVDNFAAEFEGCLAGNWSWANVLYPEALELICNHFEAVLRDRDLLHTTVGWKRSTVATPHISDMNALLDLACGNRVFCNQSALPAKGFDDNIYSSLNGFFAMEGAIKSLRLDGHSAGQAQ